MPKKLTTEEFITKAKTVHGGKYDYSMVEYIDREYKVKIFCPKHGVFEQTPDGHLRGRDCRFCAAENKSYKTRLTTEEFIVNVKIVHGGKYDYSKVEYVGAKKKVKIICPKHGVFEQTPDIHLRGYGCPSCGGTIKSSTEEFITKSREIHESKYDYSQVEYVTNKHKVKIICPKHGMFEQKPSDHLQGCGCSSCAKSGYNRNKPGTLYYAKLIVRGQTFYKIGITNNTPKKRLSGIGDSAPEILYSKRYKDGSIPPKLERDILNKYRHLTQDDIRFDGSTESFTEDIRPTEPNLR